MKTRFNNNVVPGPSYKGHDLCSLPGAFGELAASSAWGESPEVLRDRMAEEGYLYLPGLLDVHRVETAREAMIDVLEQKGRLDPLAPRDALKVNTVPPYPGAWSDQVEWANGIPEVAALLYEAELMEFWERFLGGPVRHFDFTWFRAGAAGSVTSPHCDTVYMNRGTANLYTTWTPLMDVPYELGGLMMLEKSHTRGDLLGDYWKNDVDAHCTNGKAKAYGGAFDDDAVKMQQLFAQRWLGAEYRMGDVLVFGMHTLHASADNHTSRFRLSTDSRYQLASEPADERWVGAHPPAHGPRAKKGMIC